MFRESCGLSHSSSDLTLTSLAASDRVQGMDLEKNLYAAGITDLPLELAQPICKYLGAVDIVSICTALPSWQWILSLQTPHSYSNKWRWIDKQVCTTLYSSSHTMDFEKLRHATMQHFEQMKFDLQFSSIRAPWGTFEKVNCLLIKPIRLFPTASPMRSRNAAERVRFLQPPEILRMKVINSNRPTMVNIDTIHPRIFLTESRDFRCNGSLRAADYEYERCEEEKRKMLAVYDCVLLIIKLSVLPRVSLTLRTELQSIVPNLSSHQTLGVVIMEDVNWEEQSGISFFMECLHKLGNVNDSSLMSTPINWRMWCVKVDESRIADRSDIFEWMCQDVIWRRMQAPELQLAEDPRKVLDLPDWFT
ncbi:hypothetical protein TSMEX_008380 [Taenia solium]|eukprot:TsM_000299200 transcript=TsM_000299200 gene=TsM_000299200